MKHPFVSLHSGQDDNFSSKMEDAILLSTSLHQGGMKPKEPVLFFILNKMHFI